MHAFKELLALFFNFAAPAMGHRSVSAEHHVFEAVP